MQPYDNQNFEEISDSENYLGVIIQENRTVLGKGRVKVVFGPVCLEEAALWAWP